MPLAATTGAASLAPSVKVAHRNGKQPKAAATTGEVGCVQRLDELFEKVTVQDGSDADEATRAAGSGEGTNEDVDKTAEMLQALDYAQKVIKAKEEHDKRLQELAERLPLLHPGKQYPAAHVPYGFRVLDGHDISFSCNGAVRVGKTRAADAEKGRTLTIIQRWHDGGFPWMYWTTRAMNAKRETLSQCAIRYGMGGWQDATKDVRCKYIYLNEARVYAPGQAFIVAMARGTSSGGDPVLVKGNENRADVVRIYRSAVPEHLEKIIKLREMINLRDADHGVAQVGWWFF